MPDPNFSKPSAWQKLYHAVLVETDRDRLTDLVGALESAIVRRRQELTNCEESDDERAAMVVATREILNIETAKLGWPAINNMRPNVIDAPTVIERIQRVVSIHHWHR
jgi:hypothetical protein